MNSSTDMGRVSSPQADGALAGERFVQVVEESWEQVAPTLDEFPEEGLLLLGVKLPEGPAWPFAAQYVRKHLTPILGGRRFDFYQGRGVRIFER